jgi:hypothetical protein
VVTAYRPPTTQQPAAVVKLDARLEQLEGMRLEGILSDGEYRTLAARAQTGRANLVGASEPAAERRDMIKVARMLADAASALRSKLADAGPPPWRTRVAYARHGRCWQSSWAGPCVYVRRQTARI